MAGFDLTRPSIEAFGVAFGFCKNPRMLRCPLADWEEEEDFFKVDFGVDTSFPSIPRAIGAFDEVIFLLEMEG
jgi:hypothetical protein